MKGHLFEQVLFGGRIDDLVPQLRTQRARVAQFMTEQPVHHSLSQFNKIQLAVVEGEEKLEKHFALLPNENKLASLNSIIEEIDEVTTTPFLSDRKIREILANHPPDALIQFLASYPQLRTLSPREKLSLTRFSENKEWQSRYHEILAETTLNDYEMRLPKCVNIDAVGFAKLTKHSGQVLKPWGVSHCKETGIIILFENFSPNVPNPHFLMFSVFLHYLFEVHHFSSFIQNRPHLKTGQLVKNIIRSREPMLPFLTDGNAHDETLYWQKAVEHLTGYVDLDEEITSTHFRSAAREQDKLVSLNLIDVLWNMNNIYPDSNTMYHLQQELWYGLLEHLSPTEKFEEVVKESLILDNVSFLDRVL
ncbi:hypothetical protein H6778_02990 [Candidatus Nomurabacteria bacterium]|uniref:Uncharacterized protein n=1 Tax=candidate division WWE3 bacterium TaxID=2053526 RepID=A0A955LVN7_UNCKA|nr:hypothetical protein [candidate division WWE3 bacterium]MCB9812596.1 hypothetical protein [Candidatus Nomurabacteria bacterium]